MPPDMSPCGCPAPPRQGYGCDPPRQGQPGSLGWQPGFCRASADETHLHTIFSPCGHQHAYLQVSPGRETPCCDGFHCSLSIMTLKATVTLKHHFSQSCGDLLLVPPACGFFLSAVQSSQPCVPVTRVISFLLPLCHHKYSTASRGCSTQTLRCSISVCSCSCPRHKVLHHTQIFGDSSM